MQNIKGNGEANSDARANEITLSTIKGFIIPTISFIIVVYFLFVLAGRYINVHVPDLALVMYGLGGSDIIFIVTYLICSFMDSSSHKVKYILVTACVLCVSMLQVEMSYLMYITAIAPMIFAAIYADKKVLTFAYVSSMIMAVVTVLASYKVGLLDANFYVIPLKDVSSYKEISAPMLSVKDMWYDVFSMLILPRLILITALTGLILSVVKISGENIILKREAELRSDYDALTGLYNRNHYEKVLESKYMKADSILLIFLDINNLKYINDTKGHEEGDKLIKKAAESILRMSDFLIDAYRFGGDEFLVVIPDCDENDADFYLNRWRTYLGELNSQNDGVVCEIACGYAGGKGEDFPKLLRRADMYMYKNKIAAKENRPIVVSRE